MGGLTLFLAVQNSSIGDLVTNSLTHSLTHGTLLIDIQRATQETFDLWDIWSQWWEDMTWPTKIQRQIQRQRQWQRQWQRLVTFQTLINFDNWEPECMTIFVVWQLRVTLDSIHNSCDVFFFWEHWSMHLLLLSYICISHYYCLQTFWHSSIS